MYLIGQSGTTGIDFLGMDIIVREDAIFDENGNPMVNNQGQQITRQVYSLVAYSFGFNFMVGTYETLNEAKSVFDFIHSKLKSGEAFLDVRDVEAKVGIQKG